MPASISLEGFRALVKRYNVSRLPVLGRSTTEVLGIGGCAGCVVGAGDGVGGGWGGDGEQVSAAGRNLKPVMTLIGEQSVRSAITLDAAGA